MNSTISKSVVQQLMKKVEAKKGQFTLFGLFYREEAVLGRPDIVVAAPWLEEGGRPALEELLDDVREVLGLDGIMLIADVITLRTVDESLHSILREMGTVNKPVERHGRELFGLPVDQAVIMRAKPSRLAA